MCGLLPLYPDAVLSLTELVSAYLCTCVMSPLIWRDNCCSCSVEAVSLQQGNTQGKTKGDGVKEVEDIRMEHKQIVIRNNCNVLEDKWLLMPFVVTI